MCLSYERYLDQVLGGWLGKSMGGAVGARFEGNKSWIEIDPGSMFPDKMPPNDDLDLQVLWLKVLEEKGAALTSDDLADAWLEWCWYPFNEYGIFRRNWRMRIPAPMSGRFGNQFWETGMGCPIRAEIWGYVFPGAPDLAARFACMDGTLDHAEQSVGAEMMFAAMASMAFFIPDVRRLSTMFMHYLPHGTPIERLTRAAFDAHAQGLSLREARERLMALEGFPEACDAQVNVPFTFLALLYGNNDLQETMLAALRCGYDTDCTLATAAALLGQILGAARIPDSLKKPVGDDLVMGIQYRRPDMTLSALARDTARVGVLLSRECATGVEIEAAPELAPLPATARPPATRLSVEYHGLPAAAPGDRVRVTIHAHGQIPPDAALTIEPPPGWTVTPATTEVDAVRRSNSFDLYATHGQRQWPARHVFKAALQAPGRRVDYDFGVAGAGLWKFLGAYYDPVRDPDNPDHKGTRMQHHFVSLKTAYLPEPEVNVDELYALWSHRLGRPALLPSYEYEIEPERLIGLRGPWCAYLARTVVSPEDRTAFMAIGNSDSYRVYLNGKLAAEREEYVWWAPFNNVVEVQLRKGPNQILVKLLRRGETVRFTLGFRVPPSPGKKFHASDWAVDMADQL